LEVNGKNEEAKFDVNELDQIFTDSGLDRQFKRNVLLGNTLLDYTNWTHVQAETGYSIWSIAISDYAYNINNQLYLDDKVFTYKGVALSASATNFEYVYLYSPPDIYYTYTTEAGTEGGTAFDFMTLTTEWFYVGLSTQFSGIKFEFETRGSNYTPEIYYFNGGWTLLTANINNLVDNTNSFASDGTVTWTAPADEVQVNIYSQTKNWIRIKTSTVPITVAKIYYCIPANNVIGLLGLSSSEILNEEWKWCSYGQTIYVTIRNIGATSQEGDYYVSSSSSTTNKENYFIYNHEYKIDYQDSTYSASTITYNKGIVVNSTAETAPVMTLITNSSLSGLSDDPVEYTYQVVGQTTGSTVTAIADWALSINSIYLFEAKVVARRTGGGSGTAGDGAGYVVRAAYKRLSSGSALLLGTINADATFESQAGWDCSFVANGASVDLIVTGASNNNVTWHGTVRVQKVSA
jgi:hypothetical protein